MEHKKPFSPYYTSKDLYGFWGLLAFLSILVFFFPFYFGEPENFIEANSLVTPAHIVPEWYLLPFYAVLRAIPNKVFGLVGMIAVFIILIVLPFINNNRSSITSTKFNSFYNLYFGLFIGIMFLFGWFGQNIIEEP
jgi:ubiquinol-cytochrome c reductase cytochrome b subunit